MATFDKYIYTLIIIRNNLLVQSLNKLDIRRCHLDSFSKKRRQFTEFAEDEEIDCVSTRKNFAYSRYTTIISGTILDLSCSSCVFLGCGERNVHDTKRAETLSRNRNEVWSLQSALPEKREEGGEESREKHTRGAHASRLHHGIKWLDSSRERIRTRSPVPDVSRNAAEFSRVSQFFRIDVQMTYFLSFFYHLLCISMHTQKNFKD